MPWNWIDTFGDPSVFGKAIGGDILNDKKSWLLTKAFELVQDDAAMKKSLLDAMSLPTETAEEKQTKIDSVKKIYVSLGPCLRVLSYVSS